MTGRKASGIGCLLLLALLLAFIVLVAVTADPRENNRALYVILVVLTLPLAVGAWRLLCFAGEKTAYQPDLLWESLHVHPVPEKDGIQWMMLAFPDSLQTPGHLVLAFLVQNCHGSPRLVKLKFQSSEPRVASPAEGFRLNGGQAGVYRLPMLLPAGLPPGPLILNFSVDAEAPEGKGIRVIKNPGSPLRSSVQYRQVTIEVLPERSSSPINEFARNWSGFQTMYETGQAQPDLEPLRLLEELRSGS